MVLALVTFGFAMAFIAAGGAALLGSPIWLGIAAAIAFGNIGTTLAAVWLLRRRHHVKLEQDVWRRTSGSAKRYGTIDREEAEKDLAAMGMSMNWHKDVVAQTASGHLDASSGPQSLSRSESRRARLSRIPGPATATREEEVMVLERQSWPRAHAAETEREIRKLRQ